MDVSSKSKVSPQVTIDAPSTTLVRAVRRFEKSVTLTVA
jgi:hypothetical protein